MPHTKNCNKYPCSFLEEVKNCKIVNARRTTHDDGQKRIAMVNGVYSGDLKMETSVS